MCRYSPILWAMTVTCKLCGLNSDQVEFYKGVNCRCKECHKAEVRRNRAERSEQYRLYEKMRFKRDPHRNEANKAYAKTPKGKASHAAATKKRNSLNPLKRAANVILGNAVRSGRVIKPEECSKCARIPPRRQLHGHHEDYTKPLDVVWICASCHGFEHNGEAPPPPTASRPRGFNVKRIRTSEKD